MVIYRMNYETCLGWRLINVKQSEIFDYAMQGIIELMQKEQDESKKQELNQVLKELAMMFVLAEQKERKE